MFKSSSSLVLAAILALSVLMIGAGSKAFAQVDEKHVEFATNVELIRGHLEKAVMNKEAGNNDLATAHAGHPVAEVYPEITGEIKEHDAALDEKLDKDLASLFSNVKSLTVDQVKTQVADINATLDAAVKAVLTQAERDDPSFWARVAIDLLKQSENEYNEGVAKGEIVQEAEYQDGSAFMYRAQVIAGNIKAAMSAHDAEEVDGYFNELNTQVAKHADLEEIKPSLDGIVAKLESVFKIESAEATKIGGWEYIDQINKLLDQSATEYKAGNFEDARAHAREAYLDNYENIEGDIAADNMDLMKKIEVAMRVDIVKMIDDRKPAQDVQAHVDQIKADLQTAKAVVTPEFPVSAPAASLGIAGAIAYGRFVGFRRA